MRNYLKLVYAEDLITLICLEDETLYRYNILTTDATVLMCLSSGEELDASIALKKDFIKRSYALRAWIHTIKGDLNFALKDYNTLLADYPESHIFLTRRGFIYYWKKNLEGALADFNQALKVNPDVTVAYFGRNLVYSAQGNGNQAKADMEKVRQSDDGLAEHYFNRSNELRRYGLGDMAEAYMKYALMIKPNLRNRRLID